MNKNYYNQKRKMKNKTISRTANKNFTNNGGITLIALVITIIVLLILWEASHKISYGKLKVMES